jgi:hypothetical protein
MVARTDHSKDAEELRASFARFPAAAPAWHFWLRSDYQGSDAFRSYPVLSGM